jgi:hypothetical protein
VGCVAVSGSMSGRVQAGGDGTAVGAAVSVAAASLSAASAAVAGMFVACLSTRIGSGVHAPWRRRVEFFIDFSPPFE